MGVFPPFLLENTLIGSTHTMSPLTYKEFECRAGMSHWGTWKAWAASWPFVCGRSWAFGGWGGGGWGGGGGGAREKKRKKNGWAPEATTFSFFSFFFFFFFFLPPPPPSSPSVLFAYSFTLPPCLPHPFSSPIRKLLIAMPSSTS